MINWNMNEGTVAFWVRKGKLQWNDGLIHILINLSRDDGSIFIVKDSDNKLKFSHEIFGKGRTDVESDVSKLRSDKDHHIAVTWSIKSKEICLYVDGEVVAKSEITYS